MQMLRSFLKCERGATAIEYAIIAGGIALAIVAAVKSIGPPLNDTFTSVAGGVKSTRTPGVGWPVESKTVARIVDPRGRLESSRLAARSLDG